jgi:hypothetical protein
MSDQLRQHFRGLPQAIAPLYTTDVPSIRVPLYQGEVHIEQNGSHKIEAGTIYVRWSPTPSIDFEINPLQNSLHPDSDTILIVPELNLKEEVFFRNITSGKQSHCTGTFPGTVITGERTQQSDYILFHLPNFPNFPGEVIRNEEATNTWHGRMQLKSTNWTLTIDEVRGGDTLVKALRREGGFAITHVGKLEYLDQSKLDFGTAQKTIEQIGYFLSFLSGMWTIPILSAGFSSHSTKWNNWRIPRITPWRYVDTWFPYRTSEDLNGISQVLLGFMEKCEDPAWHDPIISAIHWYVEANLNAGAVEGAIVLGSSALKLLAWMYLVNGVNRLTSANFNGNKAEDNLRVLLTEMQIPIVIPSELTELQIHHFKDGPEALVKLRNRIVHPPSRTGQQYITQYPFELRQQGRDLTMWYLEMVLLRLFSYEGAYYKRFLKGFPSDVRAMVPWKP